MKTKNYVFVLLVIAGILCVPVLAMEEQPVLLGRANPTLAGIEQVYVTIVSPDAEPNKDGLIFHELEMKVINRLNEAGIRIAAGIAGNILELDELRVYIDMLKLEGSQQYVFCIRTSVARKVILPKQRRLGLKADVWKTEAVLDAAAVQGMPDKITNVVLEQTEAFITTWISANPPGKQPSSTEVDQTVRPAALKQVAGQTAAEYKYVASKNSKVFHRSGCSSAQRIKPGNLIGYADRTEAVKAGRRPCKRCKP